MSSPAGFSPLTPSRTASETNRFNESYSSLNQAGSSASPFGACLLAAVLQKLSPKGFGGFRWQKRLFKLFDDRIVYYHISTNRPVGEIWLVCITDIHPNESHTNRFQIVLGRFRTFDIQAPNSAIRDEWVAHISERCARYRDEERERHLKFLEDKFWKIEQEQRHPDGRSGIDEDIGRKNGRLSSGGGNGNGNGNGKKSYTIGSQHHLNQMSLTPSPISVPSGMMTGFGPGGMMMMTPSSSSAMGMGRARRMSCMDTILPHDIDEYIIFDEFCDGPFGKVAFVNTASDPNLPYLLQICSKSDTQNHAIGLASINTCAGIINPYVMTQLRRGETSHLSWAVYHCGGNGTLGTCLTLFKYLDENTTRVVIAEIIVALRYLHETHGMTFPSLSPDSVFLSKKCHTVLTDFSFSLPSHDPTQNVRLIHRSGPLVYAPPEFLKEGNDDMISDWWRCGVLVFHLLNGYPPFHGTRSDVCRQITKNTNEPTSSSPSPSSGYDFEWNTSNRSISSLSKSFVNECLRLNRSRRLGCGNEPNDEANGIDDVSSIMNHPFFRDIDWSVIEQKLHSPPDLLRQVVSHSMKQQETLFADRDPHPHPHPHPHPTLYGSARNSSNKSGATKSKQQQRLLDVDVQVDVDVDVDDLDENYEDDDGGAAAAAAVTAEYAYGDFEDDSKGDGDGDGDLRRRMKRGTTTTTKKKKRRKGNGKETLTTGTGRGTGRRGRNYNHSREQSIAQSLVDAEDSVYFDEDESKDVVTELPVMLSKVDKTKSMPVLNSRERDEIAAAAILREPIVSSSLEKKDNGDEKTRASSPFAFGGDEDVDGVVVVGTRKRKSILERLGSSKKIGNALVTRTTDLMRGLVSKKKRRFVDENEGFNLDLTYITHRIIAMGYPSEGAESVYRNPMSEVQRFFVTKHGRGHFKVYNLCIERDREYDACKFTDHGGEVARYGFKDHNVPSIEMIHEFCKDTHEFLSRDANNTVGIHCKAGKGRTGVMISAYLFYAHICKSAEEALFRYGEARTHNAKGVTIPSQARFVYYYESYILSHECIELNQVVLCKKIRLNTVPNFDIGGGCDPYFIILDLNGAIIYDYSASHEIVPVRPRPKPKPKPKKKRGKGKGNTKASVMAAAGAGLAAVVGPGSGPGSGSGQDMDFIALGDPTTTTTTPSDDDVGVAEDVDDVDMNGNGHRDASGRTVVFDAMNIILQRECKFVFYDRDLLTSDDIMCWCWLHTSFLEDASPSPDGLTYKKYVHLSRENIDGAVKDKRRAHFDDDFSIEFWFDLPLEDDDDDADDGRRPDDLDDSRLEDMQQVFLHNADKRKSALV